MNEPTLYAAVDPGLTGALAVIDQAGVIHLLADLPTIQRGSGRVTRELDAAGLAHIVRPFVGKVIVATVETVSSRPGQGVASMFSLGHSSGIIAGVLTALGVPVQGVAPARWKKAMGLIGTDKEAARAAASRLFPSASLHRVKDHNRADSLLIALWASRQAAPAPMA
jgi:crossover junction endodeoxyribonuclease RuvC